MLAPIVIAATLLTIDTAHPLARFDPQTAIGATVDAHGRGENAQIYTPANIRAMLSAGFKPLSYRLATELCGEAWHWNPRGTFSNGDRGYWTSDDDSPEPIVASYGYRLPRRGNTLDQARNDDYSRIDDGDPATFWKSNPYLGDAPQWILADLGAVQRVTRVEITFAKPAPASYALERWTGPDDPTKSPTIGEWSAFDNGDVVRTRWVRIVLGTGKSACPPQSDWRDCVGVAVAELSIFDGERDLIQHAPKHEAQSVIWVSSTDPWHRATDIDLNLEQPGFDLVAKSGLTRGLPMLAPVSLLYGTPADSANEIAFLLKRGIAVTHVEMGEEPDGQNISPEDYAKLYKQWAEAIHHAAPRVKLGGPAFQSTRDYVAFWPDARGRTSWVARFLDALGETDFDFFSFEWYPVDDLCSDAHKELLDAPRLYAQVVARWRREGLPRSVPLLVTEYGWSSYASKEEVEATGAIFDVDFLADFLAGGGAAAYFYGLEPEPLFRERTKNCATVGNLVLFVSDDEHHIVRRVPAFDAVRKVTAEWLAPRGTHAMLRVRGTDATLRAWAVRRPDGSVRVLLINKGLRARDVRVGAKAMTLPPMSITVASAAPPSRASRAPAARGQRRE